MALSFYSRPDSTNQFKSVRKAQRVLRLGDSVNNAENVSSGEGGWKYVVDTSVDI